MDRHLADSLDHWLTTPPDLEPPDWPDQCPSECSACGPDGCDPACEPCAAENAAYEAHLDSLEHDCPKQEFLDDPITVAYGVGAEMMALVPCAVCDAEAAQ